MTTPDDDQTVDDLEKLGRALHEEHIRLSVERTMSTALQEELLSIRRDYAEANSGIAALRQEMELLRTENASLIAQLRQYRGLIADLIRDLQVAPTPPLPR